MKNLAKMAKFGLLCIFFHTCKHF